jgi:hypothetical protein
MLPLRSSLAPSPPLTHIHARPFACSLQYISALCIAAPSLPRTRSITHTPVRPLNRSCVASSLPRQPYHACSLARPLALSLPRYLARSLAHSLAPPSLLLPILPRPLSPSTPLSLPRSLPLSIDGARARALSLYRSLTSSPAPSPAPLASSISPSLARLLPRSLARSLSMPSSLHPEHFLGGRENNCLVQLGDAGLAPAPPLVQPNPPRRRRRAGRACAAAPYPLARSHSPPAFTAAS